MSNKTKSQITELEIKLILETINEIYGYDFREYAKASLKRRFEDIRFKFEFKHLSDMIPKLIHDENFFKDIVNTMTITVTEMFRNPEFFCEFSEKVIPVLKTYPFIKIWHAGCSSGEEVYSMAILLKKHGLLKRTQIYGTDINRVVLEKAKKGVFDLKAMKKHKQNYDSVFNDESFLDNFTVKYNAAKINDEFKKHITFSFHNLISDNIFTEAQVVICRNVMIYFNRNLHNRALTLFHGTLCNGGFLCLGDKENLTFSSVAGFFDTISTSYKIYKKKFMSNI